jgi:hypothetical protein
MQVRREVRPSEAHTPERSSAARRAKPAPTTHTTSTAVARVASVVGVRPRSCSTDLGREVLRQHVQHLHSCWYRDAQLYVGAQPSSQQGYHWTWWQQPASEGSFDYLRCLFSPAVTAPPPPKSSTRSARRRGDRSALSGAAPRRPLDQVVINSNFVTESTSLLCVLNAL